MDGYSNMLLNILDLEQATVLDIIVPRNEMVGLDLSEDWDAVLQQITNTFYTRLPVYEDEVDNIIGILHVRTVLPRMARGTLDMKSLRQAARKPYFIPESTSLPKQLLEFQERERRMGLVVDEYGDIQGLLTLDDILEEIVGEFTSEPKPRTRRITKTRRGSFVVDGGENIRHLNRRLGWNLPSEGAKTLNGLLLEQLESIPEPGTEVEIEDLQMTIRDLQENAIKTVEISPIAGDSGK
jgi:Mg2+/Co2+ transporter CorB